jgi:hypothetical protein
MLHNYAQMGLYVGMRWNKLLQIEKFREKKILYS